MRIPVKVVEGTRGRYHPDPGEDDFRPRPAGITDPEADGEELAPGRSAEAEESLFRPKGSAYHRPPNPEPAEPAEEFPNGRPHAAGSRDDLSADGEEMDWEKLCLRLKADFANYKRHAESERDRLAGLGQELVLEDLFPVVEHMERALAAAAGPGADGSLREGLELVYRELLGVLEKHGAERVPARGEPFDPRVHHAVAVVKTAGVPENTVVEEVRPGFIRQGKLLRPAAVIVAG